MLYFLNIAPQKEARDCSHKDILVPSCLNLSLSAPASASTRQYPNTSYEIFVKYFKESTTGPIFNMNISQSLLVKMVTKTEGVHSIRTYQVVIQLNLYENIIE